MIIKYIFCSLRTRHVEFILFQFLRGLTLEVKINVVLRFLERFNKVRSWNPYEYDVGYLKTMFYE